MKKELIISSENEQLALEQACKQFQCQPEDVQVTNVHPVKKSLFGKIKQLGQYKVIFNDKKQNKLNNEEKSIIHTKNLKEKKIQKAKEYLKLVASHFADVETIEIEVEIKQNYVLLNLCGERARELIGHHGETLDALQYLTSLIANQTEGEYVRFMLDSGGFRKKREQTLASLGKKMALKVLKTGKKVTLESMNPYERRLVHSAVSEIDGVFTKSIGTEPHRKVVVYVERLENKPKNYHLDESCKPKEFVSNQPSTYNFEKEFLKKDGNQPYGKIEIGDDSNT